MTISIRPSISKPRKSQLILEGTAAGVSSVLLLWLFLWFIHQKQPDHKVVSFPVQASLSAGLATHLEADARGISRVDDSATFKTTTFEELPGKISRALENQGSALVLSIAAPTLPGRPGWNPALIEQVAREARDNVLIVLDLAQVDSDRDQGVFGNAPYSRLGEQLEKIDTNSNVYVLCSCAPGQKSWMIDELGRSAFSYFLQRGLAGDAKADDGTGPLTVEALHNFVLRNTAQWARIYRRGAIQTPILLKVGPKTKSFLLPRIDVKKPDTFSSKLGEKLAPVAAKGAASEPKPKEGTAKPAPEKGSPEEKPRNQLRAALIDEWKARATLDETARAPYRDAPGHWRIYEAALLRAEREVRASWNDPNLRDQAGRALETARQRRVELQAVLAEANDAEANFPFHPVQENPDGRKVLNASLLFVTGRFDEKLEPGPAIAAPSNANLQGTTRKVEDKGAEPLPRELERAAIDWPTPFLELQLPAWAYRFHAAFGIQTFKDDRPANLLRDAVLARLPAEAALARDRRGLLWIKQAISDGDDSRRKVQDDLFAIANPAEATRLKERINDYERKYDDALRRIDRFHKARSLFEEIAARLPYYGEWAILEDVRNGAGVEFPPDGIPSLTLSAVLKPTGRLVEMLREETEPDDLTTVLEQATIEFKNLEKDYKNRVDLLVNREGKANWRDIDDVLATPLISPSTRERLLVKILPEEPEEPEVTASSDGSDVRPDPGFLRKALCLARLDVELRKLAGSGREAVEGPEEDDKLAKLVRSVGESDFSKADEGLFAGFTEVSKQAQRIAGLFFKRWAGSIRDAKATVRNVADLLRAADRDARFRSVGELNEVLTDADLATKEYEDLARKATIRFHASRLAQDYVKNLDALNEKIADGRPVPTAKGILTPTASPGPVEIDLESRLAILPIGVKIENESGPEKVPDGRAFVGVLSPETSADPKKGAAVEGGEPRKEEPRLQVMLEKATARVGISLAGGLVNVRGPSQDFLPFRVKQISSADPENRLRKLTVKVFYRGRVDGDGQTREVAVGCQDFGEDFVISIRQDREALGRIYTPKIAEEIRDQFLDHETEGYMHCGGQLDYILSVTNRTPEPQELRIERSFEQPEGTLLRKLPPLVFSLAPRQSKDLPSARVTADEVPFDKPLWLKVRAFDVVTRKPLGSVSKDYRFQQSRLSEYIDVQPKFTTHTFRGEKDLYKAFQVRVVRLPSDKVTEPIMTRNVRIFINESEPTEDVGDKIMKRDLDQNWREAYYKIIDPRQIETPRWQVEVEGVPWKK